MRISGRILMLGVAAVSVFAASSAVRAAQSEKSYTGIVTASQMASTGSSSLGLWEKKLNCHGQVDCAQRLVKAGGKYVLVTSKGTFKLNDQTKAAQYVAQRVTVTGDFDNSKKTIEVANIDVYNPNSTTAGVQ